MRYLKAFVLFLMTSMCMPLYAIDDPVNINSADAREIQKELTGVTETIAERIVEYRETYGPFATREDLLKVEGVERDVLNLNRNNIHVKPNQEEGA